MSQEIANAIKAEFERITGIEVLATFMPRGEMHIPTTLPKGKTGVYVFLTGSHCFKVGKAGGKSKARWNSQQFSSGLGTGTFPTQKKGHFHPAR